jgi:hypothetical protein
LQQLQGFDVYDSFKTQLQQHLIPTSLRRRFFAQ